MDWRSLSREAALDLTPDEDAIVVVFRDGRRQWVHVAGPANGLLRVWSIVLAEVPARDRPKLAARACLRNETTDLVGFKVDAQSRLIGEAWVPVAGLDAEEWALLVRHVARCCDRLEHALTGMDAARTEGA